MREREQPGVLPDNGGRGVYAPLGGGASRHKAGERAAGLRKAREDRGLRTGLSLPAGGETEDRLRESLLRGSRDDPGPEV